MHKPLSIPSAALALLCAAVVSALASGEWEELHGCRLIENGSNDGDSFHVDVDGEERIFRLYFVDSPESGAGGRVASRISDQAETFGITEEESIEIGKKAAAFTSAVLSRPFTVLTRGQNAMGASQLKREYAFVTTADGEDLGELLVSRGLARSFGEDAATPDSKAGDLRDRYDALEAKARREKVGAWGDGASVPTMALPDSSAPSTPLISFGSVTIGTTEEQFLREYPQAERGEDGHDEIQRLHLYFLTPPDSIDADKTTFIFAKNRLIQINHNYDKPRVEERGGWQTDYENLSEMFESAGKPQEAHPLGPKTKHAFFWESKTTSDAASLDVFPDGSSQVTFYTTAR
jgi:endonuclease YncB( thermonuclease family)